MDNETTPHDQERVLTLHLKGDNPLYLIRSVFRHRGLERVVSTKQPRGREAVLALALLAVRTRASALRGRSAVAAEDPVRLEGTRKPRRTPASSLYDGMEKQGTPWQRDIFGTRAMLERCVKKGRRGETYFVCFNYEQCAPRQIGIRWNDEDISDEPARLAALAEKLEAAWRPEVEGQATLTEPFPFTYQRVSAIKRIEDDGILVAESYHEVLAHGPCADFDHGVDVTAEELVAATPVSPVEWDVRAVLGADAHRVSYRLGGHVNGNELQYYVHVDPPLHSGETFGYRRRCKVPNYFPLRRSELASRSADPRFPERWKREAERGHLCYGTCFDVIYPMEFLTVVLYFPAGFTPRSCDVFAVTFSHSGGAENPIEGETRRCRRPEYFRYGRDAQGPGFVVELTLPSPRPQHTYVVAYEPDAE